MSIVTFGNELNSVFLMSLMAFLLAMLLTPVYTYFAYKYKFWKTQRTAAVTGEKLKIFNLLHKKKIERHIPTMAGIIAVVAIVAVTLAFNLDRAQTWLPLAALVGGAAIGLIDDILNVFGSNRKDAGLRSWVKFAMIIGVGLVLGWFFFCKLSYSSVHIPYVGDWQMGAWIVGLSVFAVVATGNAVNISDGLDGLAGGLLVMSFSAFGVIALLQGHLKLAAFCFTVVGALLSYMLFNIFTARIFIGELGFWDELGRGSDDDQHAVFAADYRHIVRGRGWVELVADDQQEIIPSQDIPVGADSSSSGGIRLARG